MAMNADGGDNDHHDKDDNNLEDDVEDNDWWSWGRIIRFTWDGDSVWIRFASCKQRLGCPCNYLLMTTG